MRAYRTRNAGRTKDGTPFNVTPEGWTYWSECSGWYNGMAPKPEHLDPLIHSLMQHRVDHETCAYNKFQCDPCPRCGGENMYPDPSVYGVSRNRQGYACCDCDTRTEQ